MYSIGAVLGSERNAVFRAFCQKQIETEFARFGAVQRTITFSANSDNPRRPYSLHEVQTTGPNPTSNRASDFSTLDALKTQAGMLRYVIGSLIRGMASKMKGRPDEPAARRTQASFARRVGFLPVLPLEDGRVRLVGQFGDDKQVVATEAVRVMIASQAGRVKST